MRDDEIASINQINFASQFVDKDVQYHVREFHQSCIAPVGSGFENLFGFPALTSGQLQRAEFFETRFSHLTDTIAIPKEMLAERVHRQESLRHANENASIDFLTISRIFAQALGADEQRRRPYPSGGALYAVETVLITGPLIADGKHLSVFHFLPVTNAFELLSTNVSVRDYGNLTDVMNPAFYVLYCVNLKKSIFKYRSRGYRLSVLETGSMYQSMLSVAQTLGFASRVLSGFPERQVAQICHLDSRLLLPTIVQAFGFEKG